MTLSKFRGSPVVLAFYPKDGSRVCSRQLGEYATQYPRFIAAGIRLLAVSTDSVRKHAQWHADCGFPFPLLSDDSGEVCAAFGVNRVFGQASRAVFIIDPAGIIRHAIRHLPWRYARTDELLALAEDL